MQFHKGEVVRGTWHKKYRQSPIKLRTKSGALKVPAGNVWIELVPTKKDGGNVRIGPGPAPGSADWAGHPAVAEAWQRWQTARAQVALLERQQRANPELTVSTTRTRDGRGEPSAQSLTLALRVPFGGGDRHRAKLAQAQADALEAELQWQAEQQRVAADWASAQAKAYAAQAQLAAAQERHRLAAETRGFFAKSFSLG